MIQKIMILVLVLAGWHCTGNQTKPPPPETVQTIKAEVEQMADQGMSELEKTLTEASQQIGDTTKQKLTPEMKKKQKLVHDLSGKADNMKVRASELNSILDGLVADYASGKISEEEFRKQYEGFKEQVMDQQKSAEKYIQILNAGKKE